MLGLNEPDCCEHGNEYSDCNACLRATLAKRDTELAESKKDLDRKIREAKHKEAKDIATLLDPVTAASEQKNTELQAHVNRLRGALQDISKNGTRHDLNPTIGGRIRKMEDCYAYIKSMDDVVRDRATEALSETQSQSLEAVRREVWKDALDIVDSTQWAQFSDLVEIFKSKMGPIASALHDAKEDAKEQGGDRGE